jgi:hypothetical protein
MHRARGGALRRRVFERHTNHHRFFPADAMALESGRDAHMVHFPPVLLVFFFGLFVIPIGLGLGLLVSRNVGLLFAAGCAAYYLLYEVTHLAAHARADSWVRRSPLLARITRHHALHHHEALAPRANFNFAVPLFDAVYGTRRVEPPLPVAR